ncbi:SDR family oxidoreductase [Vulcaniibacterium tengchongense]|uniref:NAD(P)-dependent dehydrogenase (Short-subunit alcohol dehydrogenase family) n=1 Tax=Vulcaniibacterium tengchongense TaxID=1273429 RepID=A0A3N4VC28_9GAMM|nr:SDR family oxidoreductase [Vulcaniibacterium tengchongense]RPE80178.1 NAD(P)-dependent dehydrogenase (short-subunit alcohol dehydrogenase family) [Vulcaniibacterium tengchongense]
MSGTISPPLVVLGATGGIGRGVVQAALEQGRPVVAVAADRAELQALRDRHPGAELHTVVGAVTGDADGARLARALRRLGRPFAGVVAAICGDPERGRLLDRPAAFLRRKLDEELLPHLAAARHLMPLLAAGERGGGYVLIGGPGSEHPWAGYGHRSVAEAALRMLARVLHDEARPLGVRVQLLAIERPVCTERNREHACPQWPSALAVGQRALALIGAHGPPRPDAVVRYPDAAGDAGVDSAPAGSTQGHAAGSGADAPTADLLPARCLQDARTLLRNLLVTDRNAISSPSSNSNPQEPSPP